MKLDLNIFPYENEFSNIHILKKLKQALTFSVCCCLLIHITFF